MTTQGQRADSASCQAMRGTLDTISKLYQALYFYLIATRHCGDALAYVQYPIHGFLRMTDRIVAREGVWHKTESDFHLARASLRREHNKQFLFQGFSRRILIDYREHFWWSTSLNNAIDLIQRGRRSQIECRIDDNGERLIHVRSFFVAIEIFEHNPLSTILRWLCLVQILFRRNRNISLALS